MREITLWIFKESGKWYTEEKVELPDEVGNWPYEIVDYLTKYYTDYKDMNIVIPMTEKFITSGYPCMIPANSRQLSESPRNKHHVTVGVYLNGQYKINTVADEDLEQYVRYNKAFRFGRALFVDGVCVNSGSFPPEKVGEWTQRIAKMNLQPASTPTKPYQ